MTDTVNYSVQPGAQETASDSEKGYAKSKIYIFICAGIAIVGLIIWLAIGTANSYSYNDDNDSLKDELKKRDLYIANLTKDLNATKTENARLSKENDELILKNNELSVKIETVEEDNEKLRKALAAKEIEVNDLNAMVKKLNKKIEEEERKIEGQQDIIDELQDNADQLYSDTRMIVGILNQELNRNQALQKEIDSLETKVQALSEIIGKQVLEIASLTDALKHEKHETALQWVKTTILENLVKKTVDVKLVYEASLKECGSQELFYEKIKNLKPNLFIATERLTNNTFGGYTSQDWSEIEGGFKTDPAAFTFSGTNRAACTLADPDKAINVDRNRDGKNPIITFGNYDITIGLDCLKNGENVIQLNKSYKCPNVASPKNFYTEEETPQLSAFEFYQVTITDHN